MKILRPDNLAKYRAKLRCENCGVASPGGLDPHHIFTKGMGNAYQNDSDLNLIALCRLCHNRFHQGSIPREQLLAIVVKRERLTLTVSELEQLLQRVRHRSKGMPYTPHPIATKFPRPSAERYQDIRTSIQSHGIIDPIKVWRDHLMDGLTRQSIAEELGIDCPVIVWECEEDVAIAMATSCNIARRDLEPSQRALLAAECVFMMEEAARNRQSVAGKSNISEPQNEVETDTEQQNTALSRYHVIPTEKTQEISKKPNAGASGRTRNFVAQKAKVSTATASRAIKVKKGCSEKVQQAVLEGKINTNDASKVSTLSYPEQDTLLEAVLAGKYKTLKAARQFHVEEEMEEEVENTSKEKEIKEVNAKIESFCRSLMQFVDTNLPKDRWLDDMNRRQGAIQKFKDGCETLRSCKCSGVCTKCEGEGCRLCLQTGRVPKYNLDQMR